MERSLGLKSLTLDVWSVLTALLVVLALAWTRSRYEQFERKKKQKAEARTTRENWTQTPHVETQIFRERLRREVPPPGILLRLEKCASSEREDGVRLVRARLAKVSDAFRLCPKC